MSERFEVKDFSSELAGIIVVDHGRGDMAVAVQVHSVEAANAICDALSAGCE